MAEQILVAYDESSQAKAALEHALATYPQADIVVLHVTDPREWIYPDEMGGGYYAEEAHQRAEESADELLKAAEELTDRDITTVSEVGQTARTIVDYAEDHDINHIIMGSHGRRGLERFLLGSVAESVVRRSPVSVTVIREERAE